MTTSDGKWIISQDSPLFDQIAVEMPFTYHRNKYMTLRDLINEFVENEGLSHRMEMVKSSIENLLERLNELKKGENQNENL